MPKKAESPYLKRNKAGEGVRRASSSSPDNDSHGSFGIVGDPKRITSPSVSSRESEQQDVSRLSRYQMWNAVSASGSGQNQPSAQSQQSQHQDGQSRFYLPSEFEMLTVNEGRNTSKGRKPSSSLAMAAAKSKASSSSGRSSYSDTSQRHSSLSSALNQGTHTMKLDAAPPGFHSPISVNPSNRPGGNRNQSRGGNNPQRGGGDFRLKDQRISQPDSRRLDSDNFSGKWSQTSSQQSPHSYSSPSYPAGNDWNRRGDDNSYRSHASSHARSDGSSESTQTSSLFRYIHSNSQRGTGGENSAGSYKSGNYQRRDRNTGPTTQSSSAIQKMLAKSAMPQDATTRPASAAIPSLTASSVYSDADDRHGMPKNMSGSASLSFSLPPHSSLQDETATSVEEGLDRNYPADDGSRASRSTASTANRSRGKNKDWRLKMNRLLTETPVGELDPNEIPISVLMNVSSFFITYSALFHNIIASH